MTRESKLVRPATCHCFLFKSWNWYQRKSSPCPNQYHNFYFICSFLASDIHVLSQTPSWDRLFGRVTNPNLHNMYLKNLNEPKAEIFIEIYSVVFLFPNQISDLEPSPKIFCSENAKMTSFFCSQTLQPSCSNTKCYEPNTKIAQKIQNKYSMTW